MTPTTTYFQNLPGSTFCIHVHCRGCMPSLPRALPPCSTPGHHQVGLEVSAAWQLSDWRVKCLFVLLLAPQALSDSLGITVTWLWVGGTLFLSSPWGREGKASLFSQSQQLTMPPNSFLQGAPVLPSTWLKTDDGEKTGDQFNSLSGSCRQGMWQPQFPSSVLLSTFEDSWKVNSASYFTYFIAFVDEGNWFNP